MIELTEQQLRNNEPIELFQIDGKAITVKLLGSVQAEKWISSAREIAEFDLQIQTLTEAVQKAQGRLSAAEDVKSRGKAETDMIDLSRKVFAAQKDRAGLVRACMAQYDPVAMPQEIVEKASLPQLESAFQLLSIYNDPFSCSTFSRLDLMSAMKTKIAGIVGGTKS